MIIELEYKITVDGTPYTFTLKMEDSITPIMKGICEDGARRLQLAITEKINEVFG